MDFATALHYVQSALMPLVTFAAALLFTMIRGRRATTSLILGLYFALIISLKFPYYERIYAFTGQLVSNTVVAIILFAVFTLLSALLMNRLLFYRIDEGLFSSFGKKLILAISALVLILLYSYHVLPITKLIDPGTSANYLFASSDYFFWWLIAPLVGLFFI